MTSSRRSAYRPISILLIAVVVLAFSATTNRINGPAQAKVYFTLDEAPVTVVVGDTLGFLNRASSLVGQAVPGMDGIAQMQLGMFLGDPALLGFGGQSGIAVAIFPGGEGVALAEVADSKREAYQESLERFQVKSAEAEGLLVVAKTEDMLETGKTIAYQVKSTLLSGPRRPTLQAVFYLTDLLKIYEQEIEMFASMAPEMMKAAEQAEGEDSLGAEMAGLAAFVEAEVLILRSLLGQLEGAMVELAPGELGLGVELAVAPLPDTNLDRLLSAPAPKTPSDLVKLIPARGAFRTLAAYNSQALAEFIDAEADIVISKMGEDQIDREGFLRMIHQSLSTFGQGYASSMMSPGESILNGSLVYYVEDGEKALDLFRSMPEQLNSLGLLSLYENLGMEMTTRLEEEAAHYEGVPIHEVVMELDLKAASDQESRFVSEMFENMNYRIALVDRYLVAAMGDASIEDLIDAAKKGSHPKAGELSAQDAFGPGGTFYVDIGLADYLESIAQFAMGAEQSGDEKSAETLKTLTGASQSFKNAPPVSLALFNSPLESRLKVLIPAGLGSGISQAVPGFQK